MSIRAVDLRAGFIYFDLSTDHSILDKFLPKHTSFQETSYNDTQENDEYMIELLELGIDITDNSIKNTSISKKDTVPEYCELCGPSFKIIENLQIYKYMCENCGGVYGNIFDRKGEWSNFSGENSVATTTNRCGGPINNLCPKSAQGTIMSTGASKKLKIRERWNNNTYKEKTRNQKFDDIQKIVNGLSLENPGPICESAKIIYRNFSDTKHTDGKNKGKNIIVRKSNLSGILAACVFKACENNGVPRTLAEVGILLGIDKKDVNNGIKKLKKHTENPNMYDQPATNLINNHITKISSELNMNQEHIDFCLKVAKNYDKLRLSGDHGVEPIAGGIIYFVVDHLNLSISMNQVCDCTSSSPMTIQKIFKELKNPYLSIALINDDATDFIVKDILK